MPTPVGAADLAPPIAADLAHLAQALGDLWLVLATCLVLLMQAGFLLLEAGLVRSKNSINVAQKNLADFVVASVVFCLLGFGLMFGASVTGWFGTPGLAGLGPAEAGTRFVLQLAICGTAATIVSGAVAERTRFLGYLLITVVVTAVVYPVYGHWVWGNSFLPDNPAWLADRGFIDFAGGTVVHATGGWVALAAIMILGPRSGRFDEAGQPRLIAGHSGVLATLGAVVMMIGWLGFNAGQTAPQADAFGRIIQNTVLAAAAGATAGMVLGRALFGTYRPESMISGMLGGLVGVTAGCQVVPLGAAVAIGAIAGAIALAGHQMLLTRYRLDDAVGAVAAHGLAGAAGTLLLAGFADPEALLRGSRLAQLGVQIEGVALNFVWAFGASFVLLKLIARMVPLRVEPAAEEAGLNLAEHSASLGVGRLQHALDTLADGRQPARLRLDQGSGDEAADLAAAVNRLMDRQLQTEARLRADHDRFRDFAELASDWLWQTDGELRLTYLSGRFFESLGIDPAALLGHPYADLIEEPLTARFAEDLNAHRHFRNVMGRMRDSAGMPRYIQLSGGPYHDAEGRFQGYRGVGTDVTERVRTEQRIRYLAHHDELTGVAKRTLLEDRLAEAIKRTRRGGHRLAVLALDLDDFKAVNDNYGHATGDALLKAAARRLEEAIRETDTLARVGGDEFVIVLGGLVDGDTVSRLCARLIDTLSRPFEVGAFELHVSASIGVSEYPRHGDDVAVLLRHADIALYHAKKEGRRTYRRFAPVMVEEVRRRRLLQDDLRRALEHDDLQLHFQPQVELATGRIVGGEALLRWHHPEHGVVSPSVFVPLAEESGLIVPLGDRVLRAACEAALAWSGPDGGSVRVAVNISPAQFVHQDLATEVERVLATTGLAARRLELEITEGVLMRDTEAAIRTLGRLHALGVEIALDDFGTGYSSLGYLKRFPLDRVKIDHSFVRDLERDANGRMITEAVISLGRNLGLEVIAEGVESEAQRDFLLSLGCDQGQGFWFSQAVPAADFSALLQAQPFVRQREEQTRPARAAPWAPVQPFGCERDDETTLIRLSPARRVRSG